MTDTNKVEWIPVSSNPSAPLKWADIQEAERLNQIRRDAIEANKPPETPAQYEARIRNEYYTALELYKHAVDYARDAESSVNRAADRAHHFQTLVNAIKAVLQPSDYANYEKGRATRAGFSNQPSGPYNAAITRLESAEENLASALDFLERQRKINAMRAAQLKSFDVKKLKEQEKQIQKWDDAYSISHGTKRGRDLINKIIDGGR